MTNVLVLWADDRSPNLGVRVLGAGTEALARRVWPEAQLTFYNYGARTAPVRLGSIRALGREALTRRVGLRDWFAGFDVVLDTRAGDSFADLYGLPRLAAMWGATEYAHRSGVPVVLTPQTIGPFSTPAARSLARRTLQTAALVMARDSTSASASRTLGRPVDVLTTDVVFALDVPAATESRDVVLNVSGLLWHPGPHVDAEQYRHTMTEVYAALTAAGHRVSLLAHVLPHEAGRVAGPDDDVPAVREFAARHAPDAEILVPEDLDHIRSVLAGARLVIGSRMHACLNALSVGTPALPLAYSRKFAPLMGDLGWRHVVDLRTSADQAAEVAVRTAARDDLRPAVADLLGRAHAGLDQAVEALAGLSTRQPTGRG